MKPPPVVAATFKSYPDPIRADLLALRELVIETANETAGVGKIEETLKWGQPSYITPQTKSGSTIRVAPTAKDSDHDYAMYFICSTTLVESFREMFGDTFIYDGDRALLFKVGDDVPQNELRACIAMALTYHLNKA